MQPAICHGDLVLIDRQKTEIDNGRIYAFTALYGALPWLKPTATLTRRHGLFGPFSGLLHDKPISPPARRHRIKSPYFLGPNSDKLCSARLTTARISVSAQPFRRVAEDVVPIEQGCAWCRIAGADDPVTVSVSTLGCRRCGRCHCCKEQGKQSHHICFSGICTIRPSSASVTLI